MERGISQQDGQFGSDLLQLMFINTQTYEIYIYIYACVCVYNALLKIIICAFLMIYLLCVKKMCRLCLSEFEIFNASLSLPQKTEIDISRLQTRIIVLSSLFASPSSRCAQRKTAFYNFKYVFVFFYGCIFFLSQVSPISPYLQTREGFFSLRIGRDKRYWR